MNNKVTLLVLTLNEIDGVKVILPEIKKEWCEQILIVDGGSSDGTPEWCLDNGYDVYRQIKPGIRFAYLEVLDLIENDIVVTFSPDGNSPPHAIPLLVEKIKDGLDLVIGSRYLNEAKSYDDTMITAFGNWLFTRTINLMYGASYTDAMVILRAFRKSLISELDLDKDVSYALPEKIFNTIISWEPLMSVRAAKLNKKIAEIPVDEPERIGGEKKLQIIRWGGAYYFQFIRELWFWKKTAQ